MIKNNKIPQAKYSVKQKPKDHVYNLEIYPNGKPAVIDPIFAANDAYACDEPEKVFGVNSIEIMPNKEVHP